MTTAAPPVLTREDLWQIMGYEPTPAQRAILECERRQILILGGFRGGKSRTSSQWATDLTVQFIAKYGAQAAGQVAWVVGADYERTRAEWEHPDGSLAVNLAKLGMLKFQSATIDPGRMEVAVPGSDKPFIIRTKSASDPTSLGMESPIWILMTEAAHIPTHDVYDRLLSRTSQARNQWGHPFGRLILSGTSEGARGWYPALFTKWQSSAIQERADAQSFSLSSESNTHAYPGGANDPEILYLKESLPEHIFAERHMGIPVPPSGLVHPGFNKDVHVQECEYDPDLPVHIGIDPGYSGQPSNYVVATWQYHPDLEQWQCIDEIWMNKYRFPNFASQDVIEACQQKRWWKAASEGHLTAVIDISGERHADASKNPAAQTWRKLAGITVVSNRVGLRQGIDRFDTMLKVNPVTGRPNAVIDPRCELGISELGGGPNPSTGDLRTYSWRVDGDGMVTGRDPVDAHNDWIKASTYLFFYLLGEATVNLNRKKKIRSVSRAERYRLETGLAV